MAKRTRLNYSLTLEITMKIDDIHPIILAAGRWRRPGFTEAEALAARKIALCLALKNCAGMATPVVVLGCGAKLLSGEFPESSSAVVNWRWRTGQLSSLLAGLRRVPRDEAFLLYPANLMFLTPRLIKRLAIAFMAQGRHEEILMPRFRGRAGHPVIFSPKIRGELQRAQTAREVVYRDPRRVFHLAAGTDAIWRDLQTPAELARLRVQGITN
jgi:CTP:molybdopterin cytidylyltransferase MocA